MSNAGFAITTVAYLATLTIAAALVYMLQAPADVLLDMGDDLQRPAAQEGFGWVELAWDGLLVFILILGLVMFLAAAAFLSRGGR